MKLRSLILALLSLALSGSRSLSQTWDELFRQKETQKEYLLLQIGALRLQSGLLKDAKSIASIGMNAIGSWRGLEKELHEDFFNSHRKLGRGSQEALKRLTLSGATPELLEIRIGKSSRHWMAQSTDPLFLHWTEKIHQGLLNQCSVLKEELLMILGNELQLEDAERAKRIDQLTDQFGGLHRDLSAVQQASLIRLSHQKYLDYELKLLNRF